MTKKTVLVVEDEPTLVMGLQDVLEFEGYDVVVAPTGREGVSLANLRKPDVVLLDLMLPDIPGREVLDILRKSQRLALIPVIVLTALGSEQDRIAGLDAGADDYLAKPFSPAELVARVRAVLRRTLPGDGGGVFEVGPLKIDLDRFEASVDGLAVNLTATEFRLLGIMAGGKGRVFTREKLLNLLWDGEKLVYDRTVDVHITNLRAKLGKAGSLVRSIRGVGYALRQE